MRSNQVPLAPSKILDKRWKQREKEIHRKKLRSVQSGIRKNMEGGYNSVKNIQGPVQGGLRNGKKEALAEQRYTEIERENRILLEKMSHIMQNPRPNLYNPSQPKLKSLNREQRRRDLVKITIENQAILQRLQKKSATYSVEKWETEFARQTKYRDMVCENPYGFGDGLPKSRIMTAIGNRGQGRLDYLTSGEGQTGSVALPRIGSQSQAMRDNFKGQNQYHTLNSQKVLRKGPIIRQAEALDENRIVLYKKGKQLGQGYYIVEISSNNTHLFIAAYDVESPESLLIELPEKRASDILTEFQNDYETMASSLQVMNKRLVLLNPKFVNQKRIGTAPVMDGRPGGDGGLEMTEGEMDMNEEQQMGEDQMAPQVENVDETGTNQQPEGGENENAPPEEAQEAVENENE